MAYLVPLVLLVVSLTTVSATPAPVKTQAWARTKEFVLENGNNVCFRQGFYYVQASIGNPPQNLSLLLDTSYGYLRVDETECDDCKAQTKFSKKGSKSFRQERIVNFGKSPAYLGQDKVIFENLKVDNLTLVAMTKASKKDYRGFDGVLGLAFEHPDKGDINLLENLKNRGEIDKAVFALYLNIDHWQAAEWSSISFGSWNLSRYSIDQDFFYVPVDLTNGMWETNLTQATIGGVPMDRLYRKAVISTSQEKYVVPKAVYNATWKHICDRVPCWYDTEPYWNCTRYSAAQLAPWSFRLGGVDIYLSSYQYTYMRGKLCYFDFKTMEGVDDWILGTHFMRQYYTLFDAENSRVGFATAKHEMSEVVSFWIWIVICALVLCCCCCGIASFIYKKVKGD